MEYTRSNQFQPILAVRNILGKMMLSVGCYYFLTGSTTDVAKDQQKAICFYDHRADRVMNLLHRCFKIMTSKRRSAAIYCSYEIHTFESTIEHWDVSMEECPVSKWVSH